MPALRIRIHEYWCSRIFQHLSACLFTSVGKTLFSIIDDQFLAKGIDKVLRTARDDELIGIGGSELNGITNLIPPEST